MKCLSKLTLLLIFLFSFQTHSKAQFSELWSTKMERNLFHFGTPYIYLSNMGSNSVCMVTGQDTNMYVYVHYMILDSLGNKLADDTISGLYNSVLYSYDEESDTSILINYYNYAGTMTTARLNEQGKLKTLFQLPSNTHIVRKIAPDLVSGRLIVNAASEVQVRSLDGALLQTFKPFGNGLNPYMAVGENTFSFGGFNHRNDSSFIQIAVYDKQSLQTVYKNEMYYSPHDTVKFYYFGKSEIGNEFVQSDDWIRFHVSHYYQFVPRDSMDYHGYFCQININTGEIKKDSVTPFLGADFQQGDYFYKYASADVDNICGKAGQMFLVKFDKDFNRLWCKSVGYRRYDPPYPFLRGAIAKGLDENFYILSRDQDNVLQITHVGEQGLSASTYNTNRENGSFIGYNEKADLVYTVEFDTLGYKMRGYKLANLSNNNVQEAVGLLYPNPVTGSHFFVENMNGPADFEIYSFLGTLVRSGTVNGKQEISAEGLRPGIYLLRVYADRLINETFVIGR